MTRINDDFLECVIYLYPTTENARQGRSAGGTGFLVAVDSQHAGKVYVYAVTNSHVIREAASPVIRLNTTAGGTEVLSFTANQWVHHPDGDDLAVAMLPGLGSEGFKVKYVPEKMLITKDDLVKHNIGPGDDVFMVGRFITHEGRQRNLPSVRFR